MKISSDSIWVRTRYQFNAADLERMAREDVARMFTARGKPAPLWLTAEWNTDYESGGPTLTLIHEREQPATTPEGHEQ